MTMSISSQSARPPEVAPKRGTMATYGGAGAPRTSNDAASLLALAERLMRSPSADPELQRRLIGFLGANSAAWTLENRARLRRLLAQRGWQVVDDLANFASSRPRTDVLDDVELVLRGLSPAWADRVHSICDADQYPEWTRACFLRAAVRLDRRIAEEALPRALNARSAELRDTAVGLIAEVGLGNARELLEARLAREVDQSIRDSINDALADL